MVLLRNVKLNRITHTYVGASWGREKAQPRIAASNT
jgi:hypothetical protein